MSELVYDCLVLGMPRSVFRPIYASVFTAPLGLLVIGSYVRERSTELDIVILDGTVLNVQEFTSILSETIRTHDHILLGLSTVTGNVDQCFQIAKQLSSDRVDVAIGGIEATQCGCRILEKRPFLDGVVMGAGEATVFSLLRHGVRKHRFGFISNWEEHPVRLESSIIRKLAFDDITVDYNLLPFLDRYKGMNYLWGGDCKMAMQRCFFCGRTAMGAGFRRPERVWKELLELSELGIRRFYNTTDSVSDWPDNLFSFAAAKPTSMPPIEHMVFASPQSIDESMARVLKEIPALPLIGVESYSLIEKVGKKGASGEVVVSSLEALGKYGVRATLSFVLGLPGENRETLIETEEFIVKLASQFGAHLEGIELSPLLVTTGSRAYRELLSRPSVMREFDGIRRPLDPILLSKRYYHYLTDLERSWTISHIEKLVATLSEKYQNIRFELKNVTPAERKEARDTYR